MLDVEGAIRNRAYEIWQAEGGPSGHDLDHWLRAEAEVKAAVIPLVKPAQRGASPAKRAAPAKAKAKG